MKKLIIIGICLVLLIVCLAPFPTRIHITATGNMISPAGEVLADATLTVKGWKLNYLFLNDTLNVTAEIKNNETKAVQTVETSGSFFKMDGLLYSPTSGYNAESNSMYVGQLVLSTDFQSLFIADTAGKLYVASVDPQQDTATLVETFQPFIK